MKKKRMNQTGKKTKVRTFLVRVLSSWGGALLPVMLLSVVLLPMDASPNGVSFLPFSLYVQALASFRHRGVTYRNVCGRRTSSGLKNVVPGNYYTVPVL